MCCAKYWGINSKPERYCFFLQGAGKYSEEKEQGFFRVYKMGPDLSKGVSKGLLENITFSLRMERYTKIGLTWHRSVQSSLNGIFKK